MSDYQKFIFASDIHGDMQDKGAVSALLDFKERWKPDICVIGGDLFDFRALRRGASEEEKRESMLKDVEMGMDFFERFGPQWFLLGNHDFRLWDQANKRNGVISDFCRQLANEIEDRAKAARCVIKPYDKREGIVRIGKLKMIHGFYAGVTAVRRTAQAYGSVIMGHGHAIDHATIEGIDRRMGRMAGCLCKLDMDYNATHIGALRHAHGWISGVVHKRTGVYHVQQHEQIGKVWSHEVFFNL